MKLQLLILGIFFEILISNCLAQKTASKYSWGFGINPTLTYAINKSNSMDAARETPFISLKDYTDSLNKFETWRSSMGATAWINYVMNRIWDVQVGLAYADLGYQRKQEGLLFKQTTYPGLGSGKIEDLSNPAKDINYNYRFHYLQIPILFHYKYKKSGDFKFTYSFSGGVSTNILLKHQMTANLLNGFYIEGEKKFNFDSTGFKASPVTFNILLGGRIEYKLDKTSQLSVIPQIGFFPLGVTSGSINSNPIFFSLGLAYVKSIIK